jgi:hypothetical protein
MPWIVLADGHEASMAYPDIAAIEAPRLAHALAQINRFNGHAMRPYSVAEHSLLVADIAERLLGLDVHGQMAALVHDFHEAITGDLSTPAKAQVGQPWRSFEGGFAHLTARRFRVCTATISNRDAIRHADLLALATERAQLMPRMQETGVPSTPWPCLAGIEPLSTTFVDLMSPERQRMSWLDWRGLLLDRFHELEFARAEALALQPCPTH